MSTRDRSLIAAVILVVIALGGYFLVVQPEHHTANRLQAQITAEHTDLSQAESQVQAGETAEAQYKTYAQQLKSIQAAVPSDEQVPQIINELQAASTKNAIAFEMVSASPAAAAAASAATSTVADAGTTATSFPSQSFSLSFTGSYFAVANLLGTLAGFVHADDKDFRATGRLISINTVSLSSGAATGTAAAASGSGVVTASVTALDYDIPTASLTSGTPAGG